MSREMGWVRKGRGLLERGSDTGQRRRSESGRGGRGGDGRGVRVG